MRFKENEGMFKIKQEVISKEIAKSSGDLEENSCSFYDESGTAHPNEEKAVFVTAKCLKKNNIAAYYVLVNTKNQMYQIANSAFTTNAKRQSTITGLDMFKFKKTNIRCFDSFITYLKTKNAAHLRIAQRNL